MTVIKAGEIGVYETVNFNRLILTLGAIAVMLATPSAFCQFGRSNGEPEDSRKFAVKAKREKLERDGMNIAIHEVAIREFELQGLKIRRQLDAMSEAHQGRLPPDMQTNAIALQRDLQGLESDIKARKKFVDSEKMLLDIEQRQMAFDEQRLGAEHNFPNPDPVMAKSDGYGESIKRQNERLFQENRQRQRNVEMQNARLIEQGERNPFPEHPVWGVLQAPIEDRLDPNALELKFCEGLEAKVGQKVYDIAEINLSAAKGLPGAETLDVKKALQILDSWANWVKRETDRSFHKFRDAPQEYSNSEAYFRILMMVCILQEDFKICYNKDPKMRAGPVETRPEDISFYGRPKDLFVSGLTESEHQGTCASLPVLYVAIGRRLGYPLKLVEAKGHLFARWEDYKERFNIEGTSRGLNCYPDQEYKEWPWPISQQELDTGMYLKSLSPKRELAAFLELRALCLKQHGYDGRHRIVKMYADKLRKQEGVDLDRLNRLADEGAKKSRNGTDTPLLFPVLTNTNSWRKPGVERGGHEKNSVFSVERLDSK